MKPNKLLLAFAPLALAAVGCTPNIETVVIDQLSEPPIPGLASDDRFELYEGTSLGFQLQAFTDTPDDPQVECCGNDCSQRCTIYENAEEPEEVGVTGEGAVEVWPLEDEPGQFVIVATRVGDGVVVVTAEDAEGFYEIPVTVIAQPEPKTEGDPQQ
jgi:hypothetical protein